MDIKYGSASVAGTSHAVLETPCQDAHVCKILDFENESILIAVVCDGAGSASEAQIGSQLISTAFTSEAENYLNEKKELDSITKELLWDWVALARLSLETQAIVQNKSLRDFACTFLAVISGNEKSFFLQIGDGAIVVAGMDAPDEYMWIFWPQKGMYANTTNFITDDDYPLNLTFDCIERPLRDIAVFSDGIENIALKYETNEAFSPFFRVLFQALRNQDSEKSFDEELIRFLDSDKVNERTDDDKTLILASRFERNPDIPESAIEIKENPEEAG